MKFALTTVSGLYGGDIEDSGPINGERPAKVAGLSTYPVKLSLVLLAAFDLSLGLPSRLIRVMITQPEIL